MGSDGTKIENMSFVLKPAHHEPISLQLMNKQIRPNTNSAEQRDSCQWDKIDAWFCNVADNSQVDDANKSQKDDSDNVIQKKSETTAKNIFDNISNLSSQALSEDITVECKSDVSKTAEKQITVKRQKLECSECHEMVKTRFKMSQVVCKPCQKR